MKIGIYTPIGRLDKYGYKYHYKTVLDNLQNFADEVLLISTTSENKPEDFENFSKIKFISNKNTWFDIIDGQEIFSHDQFPPNEALAVEYFKKNNFDIYLHIHVNQYIPESSADELLEVCRKMLEEDKPFEWLYKKYQLRDVIFNSDICVPWILNLKIENPYRITADSITNMSTKDKIKIRSGNFVKYNSKAIVDILEEFTIEDAQNKYEFTIKELRKMNRTYNPADISNLIFNKDEYLLYCLNKINMKYKSEESLDETGKKILVNSGTNFVSSYLHENYKPRKKSLFAILLDIINKI